MLDGRKVLVGIVIVLMASVQGCLVGSTAGVTGYYVTRSKPMTARMTEASNAGGVLDVEEAVKIWLQRNQLPVPVFDGRQEFKVRATQMVQIKGMKGGRKVELLAGEKPIAEYVVSWDKTPLEYRVLLAKNLLYGGNLNVDNVPVLKTYDLQ